MACGHLSLLLLLLGLSQVVVHAFIFSRDRHWPGRRHGGEVAGGFRPRAWRHDIFSHQHGRRGRLDSSEESSDESSEESKEESKKESSVDSSGSRKRFRFVFHHRPLFDDSGFDSWIRHKQEWLRRLLPPGWHRLHLPWMSGSSGSKRRTTPCPLAATRRPTTTAPSTPVPTLPSVASVAITEGVEEGSGVISEFEIKATQELRKTARPFVFPHRSSPKPWRENESGKLTPRKVDFIATTAKPTSATEEITLPVIIA